MAYPAYRRIRRVLLHEDLLLQLITSGPKPAFTVQGGGPPEMRIVRTAWDNTTNLFYIFVVHPGFEPIKEGEEVPILDITISREVPAPIPARAGGR